MPIYEFHCNGCGKDKEVFKKSIEDAKKTGACYCECGHEMAKKMSLVNHVKAIEGI